MAEATPLDEVCAWDDELEAAMRHRPMVSQVSLKCIQQELLELRERVALLEAQATAPREDTRSTTSTKESLRNWLNPMPALERKGSFNFGSTCTTHSLQESFWDAMLCTGMEEVGCAGSMMIFFGVFVSMALQLLFCWIVVSCFRIDAKYADLAYLRDWRILYGHSFANYDEVTGSSLVSKVCNGMTFDRQWWNYALIMETRTYLTPIFGAQLPHLTTGVVLCSMALMIWACHIGSELQNVGSFAQAVYRLPRGATTVNFYEGRRRFEAISYTRIVLLTFVIVARFAIAVILGWSGGRWLCETRDVTNIMLNAVALLFILEIDDLLYKVLAPKNAMEYLSSLKELYVGERKTWAGMDLSSLMKVIVLAVTVSMFFMFCIYENAMQAAEAWSYLCGGHLDFVYGSHPTLGPIFVADTEPYNLTRAANLLPNMRPLVEDVVYNYGAEEVEEHMWRKRIAGRSSAAMHLGSVAELQKWMAMSDREAVEQYGMGRHGKVVERCGDAVWREEMDSDVEAWTWGTLHALTGASSCREAIPFCDDQKLPLVRMLCPVTCGCTDIASGLFVRNGCNPGCLEDEQSRNETCPNEVTWRRWWRGFYESKKNAWHLDNPMMQFAQSTDSVNCSFVTTEDWIRSEFCNSEDHRPGTALCPTACGCDVSASKWCPVKSFC